MENADIRVLSVTVQPGETEKAHQHGWPSVLVFTSLPKIVDYDLAGKEQTLPLPDKIEMPLVLKLPPQAAHYVKVTDDRPLHLIRIEFKKGFPENP
jgi:hypothetical protein